MRRLVMARPGINSLEQIVSARMNLTASLYHHHKIRACDCMLKGVFLFCRENGIKLCGRLIESAADFLHFTDFGILSEAGRTKDRDVREMLSNIVIRRPYKRALVFSMNSFRRPEYEEETEETEKADLNLVHKLIDLPFEEHRELSEHIWRAAGKPGRKEEVWLDFPKGPKSKGKKLRAVKYILSSQVRDFNMVFREYTQHPEAKSLAPDGSPCTGTTRGLLRRRPIEAITPFVPIGKEVDRSMQDDLNVFSDVRPIEDRPGVQNQPSKSEIWPDGHHHIARLLEKTVEHLSTKELARKTGLDRNTIRRVRRGERVHSKTRLRLLKLATLRIWPAVP